MSASLGRDYYARSPEAYLVGLARRGDRGAFEELVIRREAWIRNLMRRCSGNAALADDLAQQAFMQAWRKLPQLQDTRKFAPWLKRLAINTWLQQLRKIDPTAAAIRLDDKTQAHADMTAVALDLDRALASLAPEPRLCIVLAYHEGMTHEEIATFADLPPGTVKSHIRRGTRRLQDYLHAYADRGCREASP